MSRGKVEVTKRPSRRLRIGRRLNRLKHKWRRRLKLRRRRRRLKRIWLKYVWHPLKRLRQRIWLRVLYMRRPSHPVDDGGQIHIISISGNLFGGSSLHAV